MSNAAGNSTFLVDPYSDPVVVRVAGRAAFQNSAALRDFIDEMVGSGRTRFVIDFQSCTSMDSTFLGVLAGAALLLSRRDPQGSIVLSRLGQRNLELVRNLGLHRLMTVDAGNLPLAFDRCDKPLEPPNQSDLDSARLALDAHENLVAADETNRGRFQDVMEFLRNKLDRRQRAS